MTKPVVNLKPAKARQVSKTSKKNVSVEISPKALKKGHTQSVHISVNVTSEGYSIHSAATQYVSQFLPSLLSLIQAIRKFQPNNVKGSTLITFSLSLAEDLQALSICGAQNFKTTEGYIFIYSLINTLIGTGLQASGIIFSKEMVSIRTKISTAKPLKVLQRILSNAEPRVVLKITF